jgi:hypothetical protein
MLKGNSELLTDCGIIANLAVNTFKDFGHVIGRRKIILLIFPTKGVEVAVQEVSTGHPTTMTSAMPTSVINCCRVGAN